MALGLEAGPSSSDTTYHLTLRVTFPVPTATNPATRAPEQRVNPRPGAAARSFIACPSSISSAASLPSAVALRADGCFWNVQRPTEPSALLKQSDNRGAPGLRAARAGRLALAESGRCGAGAALAAEGLPGTAAASSTRERASCTLLPSGYQLTPLRYLPGHFPGSSPQARCFHGAKNQIEKIF